MNVDRRPKVSALPALVFWLLVWQLGAMALGNPLLLPTPLQVLRCLGRLGTTGAFWQTTFVSIGRILVGVVCATAMGILLAVLTCARALLHALIGPAMTAMQATPVASFTILVLIWLDRDYVPVLICGMMVLPVIWNSVSGGIRAVDRQLLERAVYNLMSNSAKYAKRGGQLWLRLETQGGRIRVILRDDGEGVSEGVRGTLFDRYRRDPGLGDSRWGIGLGMQIVLKAARIHGGTLLMRQIAEGGTEMVLSLNPGQPEAGVVRTPMLYLDYAGARDHALIELADVLPGMVYSVDNIN